MLHLNNNVKVIRKLWNMSQTEFSALFTNFNLNKQKYFEKAGDKVDPLYMQELSKMTGIPEEELLNKKVDSSTIPAKPIKNVEKDENGKRGTNDVVSADILQMLRLSLEANVIHAEANRDNGVANKDNAHSLRKLVDVLVRKFNLDDTGGASQLSKEGGQLEKNVVGQLIAEDKLETHSPGI